jgi:predicted nucleic-acid-binding protein
VKGLDTNVLVRFLTRDDPAQFVRAERAIETLAHRGESMRIDIVVLCELVWVLRAGYGLERGPIADAIDSLLEVAAFEIEDRDLVRVAVAAYRRAAGDLSDCLVGLRNARAGCESTLTFDRVLRRLDGFELL